jgi:hypothetical protein
MALIQFAADCNETKCKSCGHRARIFCTYLEGAGRNSELTPYESRSRNCPGPCPPQHPTVPSSTQLSGQVALQACACGLHLPPAAPHPAPRAALSCVVMLVVRPSLLRHRSHQINLDSKSACLHTGLALRWAASSSGPSLHLRGGIYPSDGSNQRWVLTPWAPGFNGPLCLWLGAGVVSFLALAPGGSGGGVAVWVWARVPPQHHTNIRLPPL